MLLNCYVGKNIRSNVESRSPTYCVYIKSFHQYTLPKYILLKEICDNACFIKTYTNIQL